MSRRGFQQEKLMLVVLAEKRSSPALTSNLNFIDITGVKGPGGRTVRY